MFVCLICVSRVQLNVINCLGLPGAPPPPSLSVLNVTMVMVRWESPNDTGNLEISRFLVSVHAFLPYSGLFSDGLWSETTAKIFGSKLKPPKLIYGLLFENLWSIFYPIIAA